MPLVLERISVEKKGNVVQDLPKRLTLNNPILHKLLICLLVIVDAYLGLIYGVGIIRWSNLFRNDIALLLLAGEMFIGGMLFLRLILSQAQGIIRTVALVMIPLLVIVIGLIIVEVLLTGLGRVATINLNLSAIGLSGLYWAAVYLTIGIGLTLTYKVQGFANFAQAEMMLIGSYVALIMMWSDKFSFLSEAPTDGVLNWELLLWSSIFAFVIAGLAGYLIDRLVYRKLRNRNATFQVMMIASLGVSMVVRALLFVRFSANNFRFVPDKDWRLTTSVIETPTQTLQIHLGDRLSGGFIETVQNVAPFGFSFSKVTLVVGVIACLVFVLGILYKTRLGRQMRAVGDNPGLAASSGINLEGIYGKTSFLSAGTAGLGGAFLAAILPINPMLGLALLLPAFAVIVLGTIGSIAGVIFGALIVGLLRALSEPLLIGVGNSLDRPTASGFAEVVPFVFLVGLLLLAPRGIGAALQEWNIKRIRKRVTAGRTKYLFRPSIPSLRNNLDRLGLVQIQYVFTYVSKVRTVIWFLLDRITYSLSWIPTGVGFSLQFARTGIQAGIRFVFRISRFKWNIDPETQKGSWILFIVLMVILICIVWLLPSVTALTKTMQIARIATLLGIFGLASFALNLHTGITGMTNFGVIFFIGIGAVTVGILCAPIATNGYGWSPLAATLVAVTVSAIAGWLLAYPTARLRMDYFAIVTISLGEMLRISLQAEPLLRAGTVTSAIGISQYSMPLEKWWSSGPSSYVGNLLGLPVPAPYVVLLAGIAITSLVGVWLLLDTVLSSPWGRILRSIREDEVVSQHHGHNILIQKAASLALGAAIAALAGALWAWLNTNIWPDFMNPVRTTFLIWAAYIVGGRGNNKGMIVGAFVIVIVEFLFNILVASRGATSMPLHGVTNYADSIFSWLMVNVGGLIWSSKSLTEIFPRGEILLSLPHVKLALVGLVIIIALIAASKGLLPEVPSRPNRIKKTEK